MAVQTRHVLLDEVMGRLHTLDDAALAELNAALAAGDPLPQHERSAVGPPNVEQNATTSGSQETMPVPVNPGVAGTPVPPSNSAPVTPNRRGSTRRAFLTCATILGGTGAAVTATGGYAVWRATQSDLVQNTIHSEHLQNLLRLYKALDDVELDGIAANGIVRFSGLLQNLGNGALLLKGGVEQLEEMLNGFENFAAQVRDDLSWMDGLLATANTRFQQLQTDVGVLAEWLNPAFAAVGDFANQSFGLLPDAVEMPVRNAWTRIRDTASEVPSMLTEFQQRLLPTLRAQGFATADATDEQSVEKRMVEPVAQGLLAPLKQHLSEFAALTESWQNLLAEPVQQAVDERLALRQQITQYLEENNIAHYLEENDLA